MHRPKFRQADPRTSRATRLPADIISDVITATTTSTYALANVILHVIAYVSRLRHRHVSIVSTAYVNINRLLTSTCWRQHRWLSWPSAPYPAFRVDFIFAYFTSKWRIRIGLLFVATIIANNPTNVFAIFANLLAIILRLAINATSQLFPFLLLLLLTLRVSN